MCQIIKVSFQMNSIICLIVILLVSRQDKLIINALKRKPVIVARRFTLENLT